MANSNSNSLFRNGDNVGKPNNSAIANIVKLVNAKLSQKEPEASLLISKQARSLLKQFEEGPKEPVLLHENEQAPETLTGSTPERKELVVDNWTDSWGGYLSPLLDASRLSFKLSNGDAIWVFSPSELASKYEQMREEITAKYSDNEYELKYHLQQLTEAYEYAFDNGISNTIRKIKYVAAMGCKETLRETLWFIAKGLGIDPNELFAEMELEEGVPLIDSVDNIANFIKNLIMQMGEATKQSIIENSAPPNS